MIVVLAFDVGTTGVKSCLFEISDRIRRLDTASQDYQLQILPGGGAEQDPQQWWDAIVKTTHELLERNPGIAKRIKGLSFCAQMQCLVLVDKYGVPVYPAMSYMDQRAGVQMQEIMGRPPRIAGVNALKLLRSLRRTGAVAASVKDPVWKYHWLRVHRPQEFARAHAWVDAKEAIIARMTGQFVMSQDSAFATLLYDIRAKTPRFDPVIMKMLGVKPQHLPKIVASTDIVGGLLAGPATQLGLPAGLAVYAGGGDASLIGVGAGATQVGQTHIYMGTSGWVSTVTDRRRVDVKAMIAAVVGADPGKFNYFAELETAGKCLEWVRDHLALDEINIYLEKRSVAEGNEAITLYDYLSQVIAQAPPGAGGVLFAPWLHGNRCPFEDPLARAMFVNISLKTGKTALLRAVVEGVCYHMRWFLQTQAKKVAVCDRVRFVGGGALSSVTAQILADILQKPVDVVADPQDVGAVGAAVLVAVGEGLVDSVAQACDLVTVTASYDPDPRLAQLYNRQFAAFQDIYRSNRKIFRQLNGGSHGTDI